MCLQRIKRPLLFDFLFEKNKRPGRCAHATPHLNVRRQHGPCLAESIY